MPVLLYDLKASRIMNKTLFTHHLKIYDNVMVLEWRKFPFHKEETTISYNHVAQVNLMRNLFFADLEVINTGGVESIIIKYVRKKHGREAKRIIDAKIHAAHGLAGSSYSTTATDTAVTPVVDDRALARYKDLYNLGRISKAEYSKLLRQHIRG